MTSSAPTNKRARVSNFAVEEERLLVHLVEQFKNIIESKKTGTTNWAEKKQAWAKVETQFNSQSSRNVYRNADQLKEKYGNLKKRTKKKFSDVKLNVLKTGGGKFTPPEVSDIDNAIYEIIGPQVDGLKNNYDDDAPAAQQSTSASDIDEDSSQTNALNQATNEGEILFEFEVESGNLNKNNNDDIEKETNGANTWKYYTSANLKTPVSDKLKVKRPITRKVVSSNVRNEKKYIPLSYDLAKAKLDFVREQHVKCSEEHELKMKILTKKLQIQTKKCEMLGIDE